SSVHDGSNDNDGSICGSDSVFYRQSEGHSMAETLTVALRVAEEAIEEAIAKAEEFRDSLVFHLESPLTFPLLCFYCRVGSSFNLFCSYLWVSCILLQRSRSAFSLTSEDSPEKGLEEEEEEEVAAAGGGEGTSSVLQSPDGNWIALHSSQLSRPSLLTKRKSLVFSVLEEESSVVSAYDEMGSDSEEEDEGGWGAALQQFRRKLSDETYYTDSQHDPEWTYTQHAPVTSPSSGLYTNTETLNSDSEASTVLSACPRKPTHDLLRRKGPADTHLHPHQQPVYHQHLQQSLSPYSVHTEALDVNFNPKENSGFLLNALLKRGLSDEQPVPDCTLAVTAAPDALKLDAMTPEPEALDTVAQNSPSLNPAQPDSVAPGPEILSESLGPESGSGDHLEEEIRSTVSRLVSRENSKDSTSSDEEGARSPQDKVTDKESEKQREKSRPKQTERQRQCASAKREKESEEMEQVNGQLMKRAPGLAKSASVREETRVQERRLEKRAESFVEKVVEKEQKRGEVNRVNKKQCKGNGETEAAQKGGARMSASSPAVTPSSQEGGLSNNQVR
ncbi:hypothetical protein XENOCAPTIV_023115, partial [Xenoophorus captivus]